MDDDGIHRVAEHLQRDALRGRVPRHVIDVGLGPDAVDPRYEDACRQLEEHPRTFGEDVELIDLSATMELRSVGASSRPPTREETPFLTAALGLAHPNAVMPEPFMPSDIDDEPAGPSGPTGLYDEKVDYW